eukprot:6206211-Pleurochrysis_carterae.AAC.5
MLCPVLGPLRHESDHQEQCQTSATAPRGWWNGYMEIRNMHSYCFHNTTALQLILSKFLGEPES